MTSAREPMARRPALREALRSLRPRGLFAKYALTFVCLVVFVLAMTGAVETYIIYRETTIALGREQKDSANALAARVQGFLVDLERQISFVTRASATTAEDHRADYMLLLDQMPSVSEVDFVDEDGRERIRMTRTEVDVTSDTDVSQDPLVRQGLLRSVWIGPVYFKDQEPHLPITMAHAGPKAGITIARVSLRALTSFIDANPPAGAAYTYVLGSLGRVIATSKDSPVSVGADLSPLSSIKILMDDDESRGQSGYNPEGRSVIRTATRVDETTRWLAVSEITSREALRPITDFLFRLAGLLVLGLALAILAGLVLARRMIVPIQALNQGASQFAANHFDYRIAIHTGDELERLAGQFNRMADELAGSYARLELKVEARTRDLAQSVRELKALEEIGRKLSSSLDLPSVLSSIVSRAVDLTRADAGAIYSQEAPGDAFCMEEVQGFPLALKTAASVLVIDEIALGAILSDATPFSIADLTNEPAFPLRDLTVKAGFRAAVVVGLTGSGGTRGVLVLFRKTAGDFSAGTSGVMQTFANQAVLAMHNARLFEELKNKSLQLEIANAHRTQFFANMSHELRTPLNAVLGYSELLFDGLYGAMPERALDVLDRIQINGKHLLGLINDVLDMTKMEAGALSLSFEDYSMKGLIDNVVASTESLAKTKGLDFEAEAADTLPIGHGDDRRLTQVILNLVGNALKFTDEGSVRIKATVVDDCFHVAVSDTGPGISPEEQQRIFDEFQQVDDASTRKKGGSGLGLTISRRLVAMHGGRIEIASAPDEGATFTVIVPVRVEEQRPIEGSGIQGPNIQGPTIQGPTIQ